MLSAFSTAKMTWRPELIGLRKPRFPAPGHSRLTRSVQFAFYSRLNTNPYDLIPVLRHFAITG